MEVLFSDEWAALTMTSWENTFFLNGIYVTLSFII